MDSTDSITIDDSLWPLLVARFEGQPSLQQMQEYFAELLGHLRRAEKCVSILDTRDARMMTAEHRKQLMEFTKEYDALFRAQMLGCATVITSPVLQLVVRIALHFSSQPIPYFTTTSLPEAAKWAAKCLEGAGQQQAAVRVRQHYGLRVERHT
jgi:hypothetical protein